LSLVGDKADFGRITFSECLFGRIELGEALDETKLPTFEGCIMLEIDGRFGLQDLPRKLKDGHNEIESFSDTPATTSTILDSSLAPGVKVLLTVLRKLHMQRGSGRRESALFRGMDERLRRLVPEVLRLIAQENLAVKSRVGGHSIWHPVRRQSSRVRRIVAGPTASKDIVVAKVADLIS
jgi:hypothetical protein